MTNRSQARLIRNSSRRRLTPGKAPLEVRMRISILSWAAAVAVLGCAPVSAKPLMSAHVPAVVREHAVATVGAPKKDADLQLTVALPMRHQGELNALLGALYNPQSPLFHHWLSVAEFTKRFGPTKRDYDTAVR